MSNLADRKKILVVDDTPENLNVARGLLADLYQVLLAKSGVLALKVAEAQRPDLILLDVMMPEMDGFEVIQRLKANPLTAKIPVIFLTAKIEVEDESKGFDLGAVDYIAKPISAPVLLRRVSTHLSLVEADEVQQLAHAAIRMMGEAGHYNDTDTGEHIWRMAAYARLVALQLGWSEKQAQLLELAAPMHDTGKIGVPDELLKAERKLTAEEWVIMRSHALIGHGILSKSNHPVFVLAADIALHHHEKWDGTGYPDGLAGEDIPMSSRIVAVADVFDALTMKRSYKPAWPVDKAVAEVKAMAGHHFDPQVVEAFVACLDQVLDTKEKWDIKEQATIDPMSGESPVTSS